MANSEEYLPNSREYFRKYIDSNLSNLSMDMKECRTGPGSGYSKFHRDTEVIDCMRSIYHHLEETFGDLSIPGSKFTTPKHLVQTWINFKKYLEDKEELFMEASSKILEINKEKMSGNSVFPDVDLLPFPLVQTNSNRHKVLDVLNHVLSMEEVRAYTEGCNPAGSVENSKALVNKICNKFHLVALQLKRRHNNRVTLNISDEYDVQDLFHTLLRLDFTDVRAEEYTPSYASGSSRIDFILKNEKIAVELKKTRPNLKSKEVTDQLIIDIARYKSHPDCKTLICFVYDPDHFIENPSAIENDLSGDRDDLRVEVIITPKGH